MMVAVHRCETQFSMARVHVNFSVVYPSVPKDSPIRSDWNKPVLRLTMSCGCKRWFGVGEVKVSQAWGDKGKLLIKPASDKDQVINSWEDANDE